MPSSNDSGSPRRDFLAQLATAGAVITGVSLAPLARAEAQPAPTGPFDDTWTRRVTAAKYKAVFDSPNVEDGLALVHATFFAQGYREQFDAKASDIVPVVVLRHAGTPLALNDALWQKYALGERTKVKDPLTKEDAIRNPFARREEKDGLVPPDASIEALVAGGAVVLACNKAAMRMATQYAQKLNRDVEEVRAEFRAGLLPGVVYQPSGIYAVHRAQEVGCTFIKST